MNTTSLGILWIPVLNMPINCCGNVLELPEDSVWICVAFRCRSGLNKFHVPMHEARTPQNDRVRRDDVGGTGERSPYSSVTQQKNKHFLTHLSQIMSFRGPRYRHQDLHLLHAQVPSYYNNSLSYRSPDTKYGYSTKSLAPGEETTSLKKWAFSRFHFSLRVTHLGLL